MRLSLVPLFLALCASFTVATASAQPAQNNAGAATATMTNADVIALTGAGLSDDIVVAKIQAASATGFDTSVDGLKALRAANVSNVVMRAMISPHQSTAPGTPYGPAGAVPMGDPDDPASQHRAGIYVYGKDADGKMHMTKLEGERPRGTKNIGAHSPML